MVFTGHYLDNRYEGLSLISGALFCVVCCLFVFVLARDDHGQWKTGEGGSFSTEGHVKKPWQCQTKLRRSLLARDLQLFQLVGGPCSLRIRA